MREPLLGIVVGQKGVGKTWTTTQFLYDYVTGNKNRKGRKVLILDVNDEYGKEQTNKIVKGFEIKAIRPEDVLKFTVLPTIEARRVRPINKDGKPMTTIEVESVMHQILEEFRGGLLLLEDINSIVGDSIPNELVAKIVTQRHRNLDVVMHFQSIGRVLPKLWQNSNWLRFHKNLQSVDKHYSKFEDRYEMFKIVELMVNKQFEEGNERFFLYCDLNYNYILGEYTNEMLDEAVKDYISVNQKLALDPFLKKLDEDGNSVYTRKEAMKMAIDRLLTKYDGNRRIKEKQKKGK